MSTTYQIVVCAVIVPDSLQSLESEASPEILQPLAAAFGAPVLVASTRRRILIK